MNIGEESDVKNIKKKADEVRVQELEDIRFLLKNIQGRRFAWRLLAEAGVFLSIWEQSSRIHYNAGKQDFGHFIQAEINEADIELYFQMIRENMDKEKNNA